MKNKLIKIIIFLIVLFLLIFWFSGIIPKQIGKTYAIKYMNENFSEMELRFNNIEWSEQFGSYSIQFKDKQEEIYGVLIGPKYLPINLGQGLFAIEEKYKENYKNDIKVNSISVSNTTQKTSVHNNANTNKVTSTEPYIPDGMQVADLNDNSGIKASDVEINYDINKVKIEILKDTVKNTYAEILITDNNENNGGWGKSYRIQKKENNKWIDLKPIQNLAFEEIAFLLDENNQLKQKINWKEFYGELDKGTYRIVKPLYNNEYIDLYSDEFEIK